MDRNFRANPYDFVNSMMRESHQPYDDTLGILLSYIVKKAGGRIDLPHPDEISASQKEGSLSFDFIRKDGVVVGSYLEFTNNVTIDSTAKVKSEQKALTGKVSRKKQ